MWPKGKQRDGGPRFNLVSQYLATFPDMMISFSNSGGNCSQTWHTSGLTSFLESPRLFWSWFDEVQHGPTTCSCGKSARSSRCIFWVRRSGWAKFPKNVHFSWSWSWLERWPKFCSKHLKTAWLVKFWLSQYCSRTSVKSGVLLTVCTWHQKLWQILPVAFFPKIALAIGVLISHKAGTWCHDRIFGCCFGCCKGGGAWCHRWNCCDYNTDTC